MFMGLEGKVVLITGKLPRRPSILLSSDLIFIQAELVVLEDQSSEPFSKKVQQYTSAPEQQKMSLPGRVPRDSRLSFDRLAPI